jgi:hypothetical protein
MPRHEWRDTELRFQLEPGRWGPWVDLRGPTGDSITTFRHVGGGAGAPGATGATGPAGGGTGGAAGVPLFIADAETYSVPANQQVLYAMTIDSEGLVDLEGMLVAVD